MKNIYTKLCLSAIGCLMMASCDFLDVVPQGTATVDDIYRTQYQAEGMVLSCYANIPNYFHPQQFPDFTGGNEIITSKGGTTRWFHFRSLVYGEESPTTTYYSLWSNTAKSYPQGAVKKAVWESIRNCYNVLNNLDRVSDITPENLSWWKGEALFLIGYYHQIMLEYYGPIVIIDKEIPMESSPTEMMTSRSPYDTCVDFIANKYSEAARLLPGVWDSSKRNRATSSAALAFKARLLLYAASPLVNGNSEFYSDFKNPDGTFLINQTYDREKWKRAMDAAKEAIDLAKRTVTNFMEIRPMTWSKGRKTIMKPLSVMGSVVADLTGMKSCLALLNRELFPTVSRIWLLVLNLQVIRPKVLEGPYSRRGIV